MAKRRSGKRYRMTPRRRAALKKAQAASARKRRLGGLKNGVKIGAYVLGASAAAAATYGVNVYMRDSARDMAKGRKPRAPWSPPRYKTNSGIKAPVAKSAAIPLSPTLGYPINLGIPRIRRK
jgi:hypothetical protein